MAYLESINSIEDFKKIKVQNYPVLAQEIRDYLNKIVIENGGHLASNLGVVELTMTLHHIYNSPHDKIIWDVGHQSYVHKILTGRREQLSGLRKENGISGFPRSEESEHDSFDTGHSSTSISAALGYARARDLSGDDYNVAAVIGDAALTGGLAFEALNDLGAQQCKMLIILNDNKMSISNNVGAMSKYLSRLRLNKNYTYFKHGLRKFVNNVPLIGESISSVMEKSRDLLKFAVINGKMFEQLGIKYIGPIDGHDINTMLSFLKHAKSIDKPVLLHIITSKGKGNEQAENDPTAYHGVNCDCAHCASFSETAGKTVVNLAEKNEKITVFCAAMPDGTGMTDFCRRFPKRFFDVGIAEEHAVTCAAGMAKAGYKPYVAIYSTFLQRAFDEVLHDVCMQNLPVTFLVDRAGIVGEDGSSHQGLYDFSYLRLMPNMTVISPKDTHELKKAIEFSENFNAPLTIRYPKNSNIEFETAVDIQYGKWELMKKQTNRITIIASGNNMLNLAMKQNCSVVNPVFIKPLDTDMLDKLKNDKLIILEENINAGGLYSAIAEYYAQNRINAALYTLPINDCFVKHGSIESTLKRVGLNEEKLSDLIVELSK